MPKDFEDTPKASARNVAERKWTNNVVRQRFKAAQQQSADGASKEIKEPEIAEIIKNEQLKKGTITRAQSLFAKEIREMLEGHKKRNLILYAMSIRAQRRRLLIEKLRRLEARQAQRQAQPQSKMRDLFA